MAIITGDVAWNQERGSPFLASARAVLLQSAQGPAEQSAFTAELRTGKRYGGAGDRGAENEKLKKGRKRE